MFGFSNIEIDEKILDKVLERYTINSDEYQKAGILFGNYFCPLDELYFNHDDIVFDNLDNSNAYIDSIFDSINTYRNESDICYAA